jgi:mono/diheme cytochrome c family protein
MLSHPMPRAVRPLLIAAVCAAGSALAGCGEMGISVPQQQRSSAGIFVNHCSGCHTLQQAGTQGSATNVRTREYKDGPNFNQRKEQRDQILYAIRNGGFSSGPMPQDIVVGKEADQVAQFLEKYSGKEASQTVSP